MSQMDLLNLAKDLADRCLDLLKGKITDDEFKSYLMTAAFDSRGVSNEEMQQFNQALEALYEMKSIGRNEAIRIFKEIAGSKKDIAKALEEQPIRQEMVSALKEIESEE